MVLPPQVHALWQPGKLVAALGRCPMSAHAADPGGRDRAGALGLVAALPNSSQPRFRGRPLHVPDPSLRPLDGLGCRPEEWSDSAVVGPVGGEGGRSFIPGTLRVGLFVPTTQL